METKLAKVTHSDVYRALRTCMIKELVVGSFTKTVNQNDCKEKIT